jgi:hypothetical protein
MALPSCREGDAHLLASAKEGLLPRIDPAAVVITGRLGLQVHDW